MSDAPNGDLENMYSQVIAEYRRLERQLEEKTNRLDQLLAENAEAGAFPLDFGGALNARYSIDFSFKPGVFDPQELAVQVDNGKIFRCAYIESFVSGVGTAEDPFSGNNVTVQATFPWNTRLRSLQQGGFFDYMWRVRDTGADHEWTDTPQPSLFGGGGYFGPLWLPRRRILGGGANIVVNIQPIRSIASAGEGSFFNNGTIEEYTVQVSFVGHEVPDGSEP